jgi:hypothetical protein
MPWSGSFVMQSLEILPVVLEDGRISSLQPECADSFVVGWPVSAKPEGVAAQTLQALGLQPVLLHSTSWRHSDGEVVLTYLAVVAPGFELPQSWKAEPVRHADLARGDATTPPPVIGVAQVLEHGLRHLAWLSKEDEVIAAAVPDWKDVLEAYVPEPFRALNGPIGG